MKVGRTKMAGPTCLDRSLFSSRPFKLVFAKFSHEEDGEEEEEDIESLRLCFDDISIEAEVDLPCAGERDFPGKERNRDFRKRFDMSANLNQAILVSLL